MGTTMRYLKLRSAHEKIQMQKRKKRVDVLFNLEMKEGEKNGKNAKRI